MSRRKDSANNIQSRRTKTPTALIIHSAARSIVAFRLSSKNRPQRYRSYGSAPFWFFRWMGMEKRCQILKIFDISRERSPQFSVKSYPLLGRSEAARSLLTLIGQLGKQ